MSDFTDLADLCRSTVETVHGDACRVFPVDKTDVNAAASASATRAAFDTVGCFYRDSQDPLGRRGSLAVPGSRDMANRPTALTCSIRFPADAPDIKGGDRLRADAGDYAGQWFEIARIDPDGLGGAVATLSRARPLEGES